MTSKQVAAAWGTGPFGAAGDTFNSAKPPVAAAAAAAMANPNQPMGAVFQSIITRQPMVTETVTLTAPAAAPAPGLEVVLHPPQHGLSLSKLVRNIRLDQLRGDLGGDAKAEAWLKVDLKDTSLAFRVYHAFSYQMRGFRTQKLGKTTYDQV